MKIAMIGHKDYPCRSGGVEVVVYELASRLAEAGESVTVYNRGKKKGKNRYYEDKVRVIRSFTFQKQSLNAMVYSFMATFHSLFCGYDVIHYHAIGPSVPLLIPHLLGKKTVATIHGLNWKVDKWNSFACKYLKLGEKIAARYADEVITLSEEMHQYFLDTYGRDTTLIKNAITPIERVDDEILTETLGIKAGGFILYIGRISPEKGVQDLVEAYQLSKIDKKLVLAGEIPDNAFGEEIRERIGDDANIICPGFVSGKLMDSLYSNCALYVLPSHTEGLPLTLLEAMSAGANCLVSDIPENTSVLETYGHAFKVGDTEDLKRALEEYSNLARENEQIESQMKMVRETYGYDKVIDAHRKVYQKVISE